MESTKIQTDRPKKITKEKKIKDQESDKKINENEIEDPTKQKKVKKERPPRNNDWKIELEKTMTIETKIPQAPKENEILLKPDQNLFNQNIDKINTKIEKLHNQIDEIKKEEKDLKDQIYSSNNSEWIELKHLSNKKREIIEKIQKNKKDKADIEARLLELDTNISKIKKKAVSGKVMSKEELEKLISDKESEYKNKLKTATEEKKFLEEISQLKSMMPLSGEVGKVKADLNKLTLMKKEINQVNKSLGDEIDEINKQADSIRLKLNLPDKREKNEEEKTEKTEKKEKPKRELTKEELDLKAKRSALFDQIEKLKLQRKEVRDKYNDQYDAFIKQQDEIYKIKFMTGLMKKIKYDENKRKWEADKDKRKEEELEKIKASVSAKFNDEIETCDYLSGVLEQLKIQSKLESGNIFGNEKIEFKFDDKNLKNENLVFMKPKKSEDEGVQPGQKRLTKKHSKKQSENKNKEEGDKFYLDPIVVQHLAKIEVTIPSSFELIDKTISDVASKKTAILKKKEEAIEEVTKKASEIQEQKENEEPEVKPVEKKQEKTKESQDLKYNEELFPSLE